MIQLLQAAIEGGVVEFLQTPDCIEMMTTFIKASPGLWNEGIGV